MSPIDHVPHNDQIAGTVTGSGRAKLRLSRGFPGCHAPNVIPQTAINRSFEPTASSRCRTQIREGRASSSRPLGTGQVLPLAVLSEARSNGQTSSVGDRSKGIRCVRPTFAGDRSLYWASLSRYQSVDRCYCRNGFDRHHCRFVLALRNMWDDVVEQSVRDRSSFGPSFRGPYPRPSQTVKRSNFVRWGQVKVHPLRGSRHSLGTGHCIGVIVTV